MRETAISATRVDERRAELLAAGVRVLRRLGFERMRLRDVASEAGVSIGLLQHYFETREQLVQECFAAACGERAQHFADSAPNEGPAWERVAQMIDYAFDAAAIRKRASVWVDLCAAAGRSPKLRREAVRVQEVWRVPLAATIADGEASGDFKIELGADATAETLLALVDGTEVAATIGGPRFEPDTLRLATLEVARHLLGVSATDRRKRRANGASRTRH
jgi:AcrR family transcriptional regulator